MLPAEERHHECPLIGETFHPGHIKEGEVAYAGPVFPRGVRVEGVPCVMRRNLQM